MKITEVRVIVTCPGRNYVAVKILTDEGLYGVGDATLNGRELSVATALEQHIAPLLIGRDPDQIEDIWQFLFRGTYWRGGPVLMTALAGIDLALWDIKGKRAGLPVYSLLGGRTRRGAMAYAHASGRDVDEAEQRALALVEQGFKAVRIQVRVSRPGLRGSYGVHDANEDRSLPVEEVWEPGPYLRTIPGVLERIRGAVGDEIEILHDVHERLSPIEAARLAKELEPINLFFLEDCLRPEHKESFRLIRQHTTTPLAMGELYHTRWECVPVITEQLIDFIRCDMGHIGGITEARKIAALAETFYVKTAWHGPGDIGPSTHAANVHLDLAIPNFGIQECTLFSDQVLEVFPGAPTFEDGYLTVSDAPGLGSDVNEAAAARYPYQRGYLPTSRRLDGSVQDW